MGAYSSIISEVQNRLELAATATGGLLAGWKWHSEPVSRIEGLTELPAVSVQGLELAEEYQGRPIVDAAVRIGVMVATKRKDGAGAFAAGIEKVLDVIERDSDGNQDPTLGGLCAEWIDFEVAEATISDMTLSAVVVVNAKPKHFNRAERRL